VVLLESRRFLAVDWREFSGTVPAEALAMSSLASDLRFGARSLFRRPGAAVVIVVSLATTIGVASAAFSVLDAVVWRALPVRAPSELVEVWAKDRQQRPDQLTWLEFEAVGARGGTLSDVIAQTRHSMGVKLADRTEFPLIAATSDNYFDALGVDAVLGTVFHTAAGRDGEIVVSHRYWQRALGGDPGILTRGLRVGNVDLRVIGVLPSGFAGANRGLAVDLFVPIQTAYGVMRFGGLTEKGNNDFEVMGRLRPGATPDAARREVEAALRHVDEEGQSPGPGRTSLVRHLDGSDEPQSAATSALFAAIVLLVLLVAAANVANMRLAQNEERRGETAIRLALGASRFALWRQHLAEMLVLGAVAAALSSIIAAWLIDLAPSVLFAGERFVDFFIRFDVRTWAFSLGSVLLVAFVGTALPFRDASRTKVSANLVARGTTRTARWLPALVVVQIAIATGIICVAGLLWQSLEHVSAIRPAMDPDRPLVLAAGFWESNASMATTKAEALATRLAALPGVRRVAFARRALLSGSGGGAAVPVELPGQPALIFRFNQVSPGYFATTGARVLRGRAFTAGDSPQSTLVVMVNEAFVRRFLGAGADPLGRWITIAGADRQIVGVVEDGPTNHLREAAEPYFYFPFAQRTSSEVTFFVEAAGSPGELLPRVRSELSTADPSYIPLSIQTMAEHMQGARTEETLTATVAGGLATLRLLLSAAGLFGVTLFAVGRRMREFGVRMALGATASALGQQVIRESLALVGSGLAIGGGLAYAGYRLVRQQLYGVSAWDATSLAGAVGIVVSVSLAAALQPALRAARVDPAVALRND
jgi:putative ABC transport system permease protein